MTFACYFATLMALGAAGFLAWCLWSLGWDIYDYCMQQRTRRRNSAFDARVGRDCYRDQPGVMR